MNESVSDKIIEDLGQNVEEEPGEKDAKAEKLSPLRTYKPGMNWNPVEKVILERRSTRAFKPDPIPDGMIRRILEAGRFAPTAGNAQSWKFIVVKSPEILAEMEKDAVKSAKHLVSILDYTRGGFMGFIKRPFIKLFIKFMPNELNPEPFMAMKRIAEEKVAVFHHAPTLILIVTDTRGPGNPMVDSGIAGQNIVLAAHSLGAATCWIGLVHLILTPFSRKISRKWKNLFGIKFPYELKSVIALGWPKIKFDKQVPREMQEVEWFEKGLEDLPRIERQGEDPDKPVSKRLRGFAGIINSQMGILNSMASFKKKYAKADMKFLLEATDAYPAAILHLTRGAITVTAVAEEDCKKWQRTGADALLQCTSKQFLEIAAGKMNPVTAWVSRKVKIRGPMKMLELNKIFKLLVNELKRTRSQNPNRKEA